MLPKTPPATPAELSPFLKQVGQVNPFFIYRVCKD